MAIVGTKERRTEYLPFAVLSERELQVLNLASKGNTDKEISKFMGISTCTVKTYWSRIRGKLGASNRTEAVVSLLTTNTNSNSHGGDAADMILQSAPFCFVVVDSEDMIESLSSCGLLKMAGLCLGQDLVVQLPSWIRPNLRKALAESRSEGTRVSFVSENGTGESILGLVAPVSHNGSDAGALVIIQETIGSDPVLPLKNAARQLLD